MALSLIDCFEESDLHMREILLNANSEKVIEEAINSHMMLLTMGRMTMVPKQFKGENERRYEDDGTIYYGLFGGAPVGRNESKFGNFAANILGNKIHGQFAQAVSYLFRDTERNKQKFTLLTHNTYMYLINNEKNKDLINHLFLFFKEYKYVAPCDAYTIPNIAIPFLEHSLTYRSWGINNDFKFSEVIKGIYEIINGTND